MFGNGMRPEVWTAFQQRFRVPRIVEFYGAANDIIAAIVDTSDVMQRRQRATWAW